MVKKITLYMILAIIFVTLPLYYMNNVLLADTVAYQRKVTDTEPDKDKTSKIKIPQDAKNISLLYDLGYVSYVSGESLFIKDVGKDLIHRVVGEEGKPVLYAFALTDRNIIVYFTYNNNKLAIKTYDLDKDESTDHKEIEIKDVVGIKAVDYSVLTNIICIDVETLKGKNTEDKVFKMDLMKDVYPLKTSKKITNLAILNNKDALVYEDTENNVYIRGNQIRYKDFKKYKLLGTGSKDDVYITIIDSPGDILVVRNGRADEVKRLDDPQFTGSLSRDNKVYIIYSDYILDLIDNKVIKKDNDARVVDIRENRLLYSNDKDELIIKKIQL